MHIYPRTKDDRKYQLDIQRWKKDNWRLMQGKTDCMLSSCKGKDAGASFCLLWHWRYDKLFVLVGETIIILVS